MARKKRTTGFWVVVALNAVAFCVWAAIALLVYAFASSEYLFGPQATVSGLGWGAFAIAISIGWIWAFSAWLQSVDKRGEVPEME